jgi:hypothetical protein
MEMIGGTYGKGRAQYNNNSRIIEINPDSYFFKKTSFAIYDVIEVEKIDTSSRKNISEAFSLGGAGMMAGSLLGVLGGAAGLAAGVMASGRKSFVIFGLLLKSGENFLFHSRPEEYFSLNSDFSTYKISKQTNAAARTGILRKRASEIPISDQAGAAINDIKTRPNAPGPRSSVSIEVRLKKLKLLLDGGLISEDEFNSQRKKILNQF